MSDEELRSTEFEFSSPDDELIHYGTPRHSGRYPWGSGDTPYQRNVSFLGTVHKLKEKGMAETAIAKGMGMKTTELRKRVSLADNEVQAYLSAEAFRLKAKGYSNSAIGRRLGKNESSVRLLLNPALKAKRDSTSINAKILKDELEKGGYLDVGAGAELHMALSHDRLKTALTMLQRDGYVLHHVPIEQLGTGHETNLHVLCKPGTEWKEVAHNKDKIRVITDIYSEDGRKTARVLEKPRTVDAKRVLVRYAEDGGDHKDGVIELRRGIPELSLHNARYAQVRIAVGNVPDGTRPAETSPFGTHYLKGMAIHSDDIPDGYDIVFNTNKKRGTPMMGDKNNSVLKPMKTEDPDNPFGASIKRFDHQLIRAQRHYTDKDGEEQLSALNIVNEESNWNSWSKNLASQMLSKQSPSLAKRQLDLSYSIAKEDFDEIMSLTNPTVRASLLEKFASQCDSDATHLQAAPLPGQTTKVILPIPSMKESEIYAPSYDNGQKVVLIRYPHGGTFEIPTLTVNNKQREASETLGQAIDAVGINHKVAERLSGADFDGDNVLVIPIDNVQIKTTPRLEGLKGFDPKTEYAHYEGMHRMTSHETGLEMGKVSNLITDMTVKGAPPEEICKAVRHSMVVIDAEKHYLDYRRSEIDHDIAGLKLKYQGREDAGAATLLSRSTSKIPVPRRKEKAISKMTPSELAAWREGKMVYENTGKTHSKKETLKNGEVRWKKEISMEKVRQMMLKEDAFELVSGSPNNTTRIETVYATYANSMKALANAARKIARLDPSIPYSPTAAKTYAQERSSLKHKLNIALKNAPLERQAQILANEMVKAKRRDNPNLDHEHLKRLKGMSLETARYRYGAGKTSIDIDDREWEAINAGAITKSFLKDILRNADMDRIRQLATPRSYNGMSPGRIAKAKEMRNRGYTQAEIANALDVSVTTLLKAIGLDKF